MSSVRNHMQAIFRLRPALSLLCLCSGPLRCETPYPELLVSVRAGISEEMSFADAATSGADADALIEVSRLQQINNVTDILLANDLEKLRSLLPELQQDPARAGVAPEDLEGEETVRDLFPTMVTFVEPVLDEAILDWIEATLVTADRSLDHSLALRSLHAGRAMSERRIARAGLLLRTMRNDFTSYCRDPVAINKDVCEEFGDPRVLADLNNLIQTLEGSTALRRTPARLITASESPVGMGWCQDEPHYGRAMTPGDEMHATDRINLAVAFGDLESAIAIALHEQILLPNAYVDGRLPDLLRKRYGTAAIAHELDDATHRIQQQQTSQGVVVFTTIFGNALQLPTQCRHLQPDWAPPTPLQKYTSPEQHIANLRRSALYQALRRER